jgi:UDP-N-acetylmuramoylalanine--D-glutamate ligase
MVLNRADDWSMANGRCGRQMITFGLDPAPRGIDYGCIDGTLCKGQTRLVSIDRLRLSGLHNAANALAALALCDAIGVDPERLIGPLETFAGLPHRVETVAEIAGVRYVDDSKGTNVGATLAAIEGMGQPVAIILGGDGKGQDFSPLKAALQQRGRAVALIGRDAATIGMALEGSGVPTCIVGDMPAAVRWLAAQAHAGDCVLLSPACASLDMYRNYAHRAEAFIAAVKELAC